MELCTRSYVDHCNFSLKGHFVENPFVNSEILHGGEGWDVERWLEPRNKFFVFAIASLDLYLFTLLILVLLLLLHILFIACVTFFIASLSSFSLIGFYSSQ